MAMLVTSLKVNSLTSTSMDFHQLSECDTQGFDPAE
jgi:hypothetical protein